MEPMTMLALAQAGNKAIQGITNWVSNRYFNKPKSFEETSYGKRLKTLSERGSYTPEMRSNIMTGVARPAAKIASTGKMNYQGRLISQGAEGSIAAQRGMRDYDTAYMDKMTEASQRIDFANEQSKIEAADEYAKAKTSYNERIEAMKQANNQQLVESLTGAAGNVADTYLQQHYAPAIARYKEQLNYPDLLQMSETQRNAWINSAPNKFEHEKRMRALYNLTYGE